MKSSIRAGGDSKSTINVLALGSFVRDLGQYIIWVIMSIYLNEVRGVGYLGVGLVFLIGGLITIPVSIYGGNLLDRIGRRKMAVLMPWILVVMFFTLFVLIRDGYSTLIIEILFIAISPIQSIQFIAMDSIVADVTAPEERVNAFGLMRIAANVGIGVGLVGGGLLSELNYSMVFILPVIASAIEGSLYFWKIPETARHAITRSKEDRKKISLLLPFRDRLFVTLSVMIAFAWFVTGMFESPLTPLYLTSAGNYPDLAVTVLFAVNTTVVIFTQMPLNRLLNKFRDSTRIVLGIFLFAAGYAIFSLTLNYLVLVVAVVILTTGENIGAPASTALVTKLAPEESRGTYLGSYSAMGSLINPFRPMFATTLLFLTEAAPYRTWIILALMSVAFAFALLSVFRGTNKSMEARLKH